MAVIVNGVVQHQSVEKITDGKDLNNFGVQFTDTQVLERFQDLSGMKGRYTVEYQFHYINAVGRINADGQRLDVAIPLVMFNYHQEVGGASVEFNMGEVGKANNDAMPLAIEKFQEFEKTDMFKALCDMGITTWELHGLNSNHMHPEGINGFSGTDLREQIEHPGVVYPLSTGKDAPSFSGMMQHKDLCAEQIIMQYRIFNGVAGGLRKYEKGRCLTINRGMATEPEEEWVPLGPGAIDEIFGTLRPQPPKPAKEKERKDFLLRCGLVAEEGKELGNDLMVLWKACDFEIDTSLILKTNVLKGRGRLQNKATANPWPWNRHTGNHQSRRNLNELNEGLFGGLADEEDEPTYSEMRAYLLENGFTTAMLTGKTIYQMEDNYKILKNRESKERETVVEPKRWEMIQYLITKDWERKDLVDLLEDDLTHLYWTEKLDDDEDIAAGITPDVDTVSAEIGEMYIDLLDYGFTVPEMSDWTDDEVKQNHLLNCVESEDETTKEDMMAFLRQIGFTPGRLMLMNPDVLKQTYDLNQPPAEEEDEDDVVKARVLINMLAADQVMGKEKLSKLPTKEIFAMADEMYGSIDAAFEDHIVGA